ncbi:unnamed protein product [Closterium sp. NIES-53]
MLALCREHRLEHRTKHIALRYFLARELQQRGQLRLAYVASEANTADIFTKALAPGDHQRFCTLLACFSLLDWSCDPLFSPTLPMGTFYENAEMAFPASSAAAVAVAPPGADVAAALVAASEAAAAKAVLRRLHPLVPCPLLMPREMQLVEPCDQERPGEWMGREERRRGEKLRRSEEERRVEEKVGEESRGEERSGEERSGGERSGEEMNRGERSGEERNGGERSGEERNGEERSGEERSGEEKNGEERRGEEKKGEERSGEEKVGEERSGEERSGEERINKSRAWNSPRQSRRCHQLNPHSKPHIHPYPSTPITAPALSVPAQSYVLDKENYSPFSLCRLLLLHSLSRPSCPSLSHPY